MKNIITFKIHKEKDNHGLRNKVSFNKYIK